MHSRELEVAEKLLESFVEGDQAGFDKIARSGSVDSIYPSNVFIILNLTTILNEILDCQTFETMQSESRSKST